MQITGPSGVAPASVIRGEAPYDRATTGSLTITEQLLGLEVDDRGVTAFTAIIQVGAILAVIVYFRREIAGLVGAWCGGLFERSARHGVEYRRPGT